MEPKNDASEIAEIQTYVFLDVETTGLAKTIFQTRLTEISLLFVLRSDLIAEEGKSDPRIVGKLTKCFNPTKYLTDASVRNSRLTNEQLENQGRFNKDFCSAMELLINSFPKPVCFLAHNGYEHDFPLLRAEMKKLGQNFLDDIRFADTLKAFKEMKIMSEPAPNVEASPSFTEIPSSSSTEVSSNECGEKNGKLEEDYKSLQMTPENSGEPQSLKRSKPDPEFSQHARGARRNLFGESYSLQSVYEKFFNQDIPNAHAAESDTTALLRIIASFQAPYRSQFLDYVQKNNKKFNTITRLW